MAGRDTDSEERELRAARVRIASITTATFVIVVVVAAWAIWWGLPDVVQRRGAPATAAVLMGMLVGASELLSRYRDEPLKALNSNAGFLYLALNGAVAGFAYALLVRYADAIFPGIAGDEVMLSIVAGFGGMAVLRSKFFTLRTPDGNDTSVGLDAAVSSLLAAADRGVDRTRAARRLALVFKRSRLIKRPEVGRDFLEVALAALQNLDSDDKARLISIMQAAKESAYPPDLQLQVIGYAILGVAGEDNYKDMMTYLQTYVDEAQTDTSGNNSEAIAEPGETATS